MKPTYQIYAELQLAYDHFNKGLFSGELPECILLLDNKERRVLGYFASERFVNDIGIKCDIIAMNPMHFANPNRQIVGVLQTIVHEMCHLWQHHFGKNISLKVYHNKEWAIKMESVGLMPSKTGKPYGSKTGQQMMDYPVENGLFMQYCQTLLTPGYQLSWRDRFTMNETGLVATISLNNIDDVEIELPSTPNRSNRIKYTCPACKSNVWGKQSLNIVCVDCDEQFVSNA